MEPILITGGTDRITITLAKGAREEFVLFFTEFSTATIRYEHSIVTECGEKVVLQSTSYKMNTDRKASSEFLTMVQDKDIVKFFKQSTGHLTEYLTNVRHITDIYSVEVQ